jgi:hypothetical protein
MAVCQDRLQRKIQRNMQHATCKLLRAARSTRSAAMQRACVGSCSPARMIVPLLKTRPFDSICQSVGTAL